MRKFSNLKSDKDSHTKKEDTLYKDNDMEIFKYEEWPIIKSNDCVICIPYFIEQNRFIIRREYVPSFKYADGNQQHVVCVGGGVEEGENIEEAMSRELQEEAGIVLRDGYKIDLEGPLFYSKGFVNRFHFAIIPLSEGDYSEIAIMGDGSLLEKMSETIKVDIKYINSISSSDVVTEFMLMKLKNYLNLNES
jgi:hypothetical protein